MAKVKGICSNDECDYIDQIQEVEQSDFVCPHCGKPLIPFGDGPDGPWWKKYKKPIIIGCAAAVLLGGVGIGAYFMTQDKPAVVEPGTDGEAGTEETEAPGEVVLTNWISIMDGKNLTLNIGDKKTLSLDCDPGNANEGVNWSSNNEGIATVAMDGTVTAITNGKATITVTTTVQKNTASIEVTVIGGNGKPNTPSPSRESTIDLGFATYKGAVQNGKPHGSGTMTFKQEAVIPGSKGNIKANAGDYVQGEWRNGEVNLVSLYQQGNDPQVITHK